MRLAVTVFGLFFIASNSFADPTFFNDCASLTGATATVIIGADTPPRIAGIPVDAGAEIAVFTPDGLCAGAATWTGSSLAMALWADDPGTDAVDGFQEGEALGFQIYSGGSLYGADPTNVTVSFNSQYDNGPYTPDAIYVIDDLEFEASSNVDEGSLHVFNLEPAFPNPFSSGVTLRFSLPEQTDVRLEVFDVLGRRVAIVVDDALPAGTHERRFEPGHQLAAGAYIARLQAGNERDHIRMTLVR